ncbi:MAG: alpha/beta hydrolase, partial [Methylibium sp.]|nr:alpha/beta hydrolase [Methylibium sp.]
MTAVADRALPPADWPVPWWLPGGNVQTIWPALFARRFHGPAPS